MSNLLFCSSCKIMMSENLFYKRNDRERGFFYICKKCCSEQQNKRITENKQKEIISDITQYKKCSKCKKSLLVINFGVCKSKHDGLQDKCKNCRKIEARQKKDKNIQININRGGFDKTVLDKKCSRCKNIKLIDNFNFCMSSSDGFHNVCRNCLAIIENDKRTFDAEYRLLSLLRVRINSALKSQKTNKNNKSKQLIGCSILELKEHLESQFKEGMTWDNYGSTKLKQKTWQIDHIRPCSSFDLTDPDQQKQCFHYTNLQPLWWWENLKKTNKEQ